MADTFENKDYTNVNFNAVEDLINEWNSTCSEYKSSIKKAENDVFSKLKDLGLVKDFSSRYDKAMENISTGIDNVVSGVETYIQELKEKDKKIGEKRPTLPRNTSSGDNEGTSSNGSSNSSVPRSGNTTNSSAPDNLEDHIKYFKQMSLSDLTEILDILNAGALENEISIDELLDNETLGDKIKEKILENPKISSEYKELIEEGSVISMMTALKSLLKGEIKDAIGLDESTSLTLKVYLSDIASNNNLEYVDLFDEEKNENVLKTSLSKLKTVSNYINEIDPDNFQKELYYIYQGTYDKEIDNESVFLLRSEIDIISELTNTNYEDLLANPEYGDEIFNCFQNLQKISVYSNALSNCNDSSDILNSLINTDNKEA